MVLAKPTEGYSVHRKFFYSIKDSTDRLRAPSDRRKASVKRRWAPLTKKMFFFYRRRANLTGKDHSDTRRAPPGPPVRKFQWMATSSCWQNRRQMLSRRYLTELPPPLVWPMNDIPDTINAGNASILISPGPNLTILVILVGTDTSVKF